MAEATIEQHRQWDEEGYLVIEEAIAGEQLARLQKAFSYWAAECKSDWIEQIERGKESPTWYDIPDVLEKDNVFIDVVDHPSYYPLVKSLLGGEAILSFTPQLRTVPCWPVSYTGWHPDGEATDVRRVKMQLYVDDVPPESGEFAYLPGSHLKKTNTGYRTGRNEILEGHITFPGTAGTAILFDNRGLHTAMDNTTSDPRRSIIMGFEEALKDQQPSDQFTGIADKLETSERRRLFRLEQL